MCVTNEIRDNVIYNNIEWDEVELTNEEIIEKLNEQKENPFLSYSYGVWVTAYARFNLLSNLVKLDNKVIYSDTDSLKLEEGFDIKVIEDYNKNVIEKIKKVSNDLKIPIEKFSPLDKDGKAHTIGLFDFDGFYEEFKTLGAKKYASIKWIDLKKVKKEHNVIEIKDNKAKILEITVSGVPKKGAAALKNLDEFSNDFVFEYKYTGKNLIVYNDDQQEFNLTDYAGKKYAVKDRYGICIIPTTYKLGISDDYANLISDESSKHARYKE